MAKEVHFNCDGSATKKLQVSGVDKVGELIGVTLGPKGRKVVLQNKYGPPPPQIVNDGETVLKQIELEDPLENVGVKLVRQAGAKTNDLAGDDCTTSIVLAHGLITEGVGKNQIYGGFFMEGAHLCPAGMNPVQIARGIEKTTNALVSELKLMSREVEDHELAHVAAVSAGNDHAVGKMISDALQQVGRKGVARIEKGKCIENSLEMVEGMQFDRGYLSPYFVMDREKTMVEFHNCKFLLDDKKITNPKEMFKILDSAVKEKYLIVIVAEEIEKEALALVIRNKLKGVLKAAAIKAPAFGERKSSYLGWRIAKLSGGIAILQVGAQTQVELKDKQLRIEDALNATKAAIEEGVIVGGGCILLAVI
ncbi:chaperonin-60beta4 [Hibiscus trionum]|uniref:Chaperonin-60beta4 n=1 Tax=Hibiscus trionum TaxID=183268 RepID=A0A9W7HZX0_HIBTR|nr:chaperonin-60beta4 [Hibiscus trionum]